MSQFIGDSEIKPLFGSINKIRYEQYTEQELESEEFFWNQLRVIVHHKNMEYFYHFTNARSSYIDSKSGM